MDKGDENAANEEKAGILPGTRSGGAVGHLPEMEKSEKGRKLSLFACVRVFLEESLRIFYLSESDYVIKNIQWTTGKDFTVERGLQQIEEVISVSDNSIHSGTSHC